MAGQRFGGQEATGGIEPGFAELQQPWRFGGPREDPDAAERGGAAATAPARDDEWLRNLLE